MLLLVAVWALAEAILFFIVADVPIMAAGIKYGRGKAFIAALVAAVCAAIGGMVVMAWAAADPVQSRVIIEHVPGISGALIDSAAADWQSDGWLAMLAGSFGGVPYKLFAHAAGLSGSGFASFFAASIAARLPRFLLVAAIAGSIGPPLRRRFGRRIIWAAFAAAWILFYALYLAAMGW